MKIQQWQPIDKNTERMRVPNGWIVRSVQRVKHTTHYDAWVEAKSMSLVFVPDPAHEWGRDDD